MQNMPSERAFEQWPGIFRVTADRKPDKSPTNVRLSYTLQRPFEPVTDEQPDQLEQLLMLLDRRTEGWG
jgi:hypothetical protein